MTRNLIARARAATVPITVVPAARFDAWRDRQPKATRNWLAGTGFRGKNGRSALLPATDGGVARVVFVLAKDADLWSWSALASGLPAGSYRIDGRLARETATSAALGWALAGYAFTKYRKRKAVAAQLVWPAGAERAHVTATVEATALVRDLINTPAEDMGPSDLAAATRALARRHGARVSVTIGDRLLAANYPMIHAVGRAAADAPRLVDLRWGKSGDPKVTLVGKGVCFDSGGLDLKSAAGMLRMKKDMGGAAHVLGVAALVMAAKLPVRLRVLIGAVENAVAGNAYRPSDVLQTRKGITVEVGNTDAEGRLVLADCLAEAARERPDLLIDFATLTGAARVAVGAEVAALFTNDDSLADALARHAAATADPVWRLPLHRPYRRLLDSKVADISSTGDGRFAGAITAALFLEEFVAPDIVGAHFDIMAWNSRSRPGRPEGGEAQGMRAVYTLLRDRFGR